MIFMKIGLYQKPKQNKLTPSEKEHCSADQNESVGDSSYPQQNGEAQLSTSPLNPVAHLPCETN